MRDSSRDLWVTRRAAFSARRVFGTGRRARGISDDTPRAPSADEVHAYSLRTFASQPKQSSSHHDYELWQFFPYS